MHIHRVNCLYIFGRAAERVENVQIRCALVLAGGGRRARESGDVAGIAQYSGSMGTKSTGDPGSPEASISLIHSKGQRKGSGKERDQRNGRDPVDNSASVWGGIATGAGPPPRPNGAQRGAQGVRGLAAPVVEVIAL